MPQLTVTTKTGSVTISAVWCGDCLAVHAPIKDNAAIVSRGLWVISDQVSGLSAGVFRGSKVDAIKLAKLWDTAFKDALQTNGGNLSKWGQSRVWGLQLQGDLPRTGPVARNHPDFLITDAHTYREPVTASDGDGGEQFPATITISKGSQSGKVRFSGSVCGRPRLRNPETGAPVRMNGDCAAFNGPDPLTPVFKLWFRGAWYVVPTVAQIMEWTLDSIVESPDGCRVEPDAPESWLSLLGLV